MLTIRPIDPEQDRDTPKAGFKPIRTEYEKVLKPYPGENHPC